MVDLPAERRAGRGSGLLAHPVFVRFWIADAVSNLGTFTSTLALQLLLIDTLACQRSASSTSRIIDLGHRC